MRAESAPADLAGSQNGNGESGSDDGDGENNHVRFQQDADDSSEEGDNEDDDSGYEGAEAVQGSIKMMSIREDQEDES